MGSGLRDLLISAFGPKLDLYGIFNLQRSATPPEIKKAYHKLALKCHPDKIDVNATPEEKAIQTTKFQALSAAYDILSNDEKKESYDTTGEIPGEEFDDMETNPEASAMWEQYFKTLFQRVDEGKIKTFADKYRFSEEEAKDVLKYYVSCKGNLNQMLTCVMLSTKEDKPRWIADIIEPAIKRGEVKRYD